MANMMDYLSWRGDLPLSAAPWNDVDSLILSCMSYVNLPAALLPAPLASLPVQLPAIHEQERLTEFFDRCRELFDAAARQMRFGELVLHSFVNEVSSQEDIQFSAVTADLPDGTRFVAFRGTDQTIVGWREDFTMAFESPVPAQTAALAYLERAAEAGKPLRIGGHSKGGNLACYAAAHASERARALIDSICSFDGPGLDDATVVSDGYARIRGRIRSYIPQSSVIGLLLAYHEDYTVVRANAIGLAQHDAFTWQLLGTTFIEVGEVDRASQVVDQAVHAWLTQVSHAQRRIFIDTLFDILEATNATTFKDLTTNPRSIPAIIQATRNTDPEVLRMIAQLIGRFLKIGAVTLFDMLTGRDEPSTQEE